MKRGTHWRVSIPGLVLAVLLSASPRLVNAEAKDPQTVLLDELRAIRAQAEQREKQFTESQSLMLQEIRRLNQKVELLEQIVRSGFAPRERLSIPSFEVQGTTLDEEALQLALEPLTRRKLTAEDLTKQVKSTIQEFYAGHGIRGVQVIIPPQEVGDKPLAVQVLEPRLNLVTIEGNRFFGDKNLRRFFEGKIVSGEGTLVADALEHQLDLVNRHPDRQVTAVLKPADEAGKTDLALTVKEREVFHGITPLHYSVETNSTGTPNVGRLMTAHTFQYTNLFDRDHIASVQWTFQPGTFRKNQVVGASYLIPLFLPRSGQDLTLAIYGGYSRANADTVVDTLTIVGEGWTLGGQLTARLPEFRGWEPSLTFGIETTQLDSTLEFGSYTEIKSEVGLLPVYSKLSLVRRDRGGSTVARVGVRHNLDDRVPNSELADFRKFREDSDPNFTTFQFGLERFQKLINDWTMHANLSGQFSEQRLIPSEQLRIGGGGTVRGYDQSEVSGDRAVLFRTEIRSPNLPDLLSRVFDKQEILQFVAFYDWGMGFMSDPLPGDPKDESVSGAGFGFRYQFMQHFLGSVDIGWPLEDSANTRAGDAQIYFRVSMSF